MIYCLPPRLTWAPFVLEPPCDSSISSLSTSHFLQCSSFSVLSIASAEVHRRNRPFIIHQTSKKLKLGGRWGGSSTMSSKVQPLSKKPLQWRFQRDLGPVIWGWRLVWKCVKIAKFTTICTDVSLKRTASACWKLQKSALLYNSQ